MKRILSKLDLTEYSDGWVLVRDGEPDSIFDTEADAWNAFYWSGRGDYEYDLGAHDCEVKRWEGGKLIHVEAATEPDKLEWEELNGADQLAVERAVQYINYEAMDIEDAIRRAVNEINDSYMEPEYADEDDDFWGGSQEASKNAVRYYIGDHPKLINPQPRSLRKAGKVESAQSKRESKLKRYIDIVTKHMDEYIDESIASYVHWDNGTAAFWPIGNGKWTLVIMDQSQFNKDTFTYEHPVYWGDEELHDDECNDVKLSGTKLYNELKKLPGVNEDNFYGIISVFQEYF